MKAKYVGIAILSFLIISIFSVVGTGIGLYNQELELRKEINAKQVENTSNFDNMWKKIKQSANVADKYKDGLKEILEVYTEGRSEGSENLLMKWGAEAVPNFDSSIYKQLNNIIVASRDDFTMNQKELIDLKREHDTLINRFPNNIYYRVLGVNEIEIKVVTSTKTDKTFETGKDDEVEL